MSLTKPNVKIEYESNFLIVKMAEQGDEVILIKSTLM